MQIIILCMPEKNITKQEEYTILSKEEIASFLEENPDIFKGEIKRLSISLPIRELHVYGQESSDLKVQK